MGRSRNKTIKKNKMGRSRNKTFKKNKMGRSRNKTFKKNRKKLKYIFIAILGPAESLIRINRPDAT